MKDNRTKYSEDIIASPWKVCKCTKGESCWCRIIKTTKKITSHYEIQGDQMTNTEYATVVTSGTVQADVAKYIVKLHNENLKKQ